MSPTRAFWLSLLSWPVPGLAQGVARRRRAALGFALANLAGLAGLVVTVWLVPVVLGIQVAAVVDGWLGLRRLRADGRSPTTTLPTATEGRRAPPTSRSLIAAALGIAAVSAIVVGSSLRTFRIPASSMYPTLMIGDHITVDRLTPRFRPIGRGEVIVFDQPCQPDRQYIKRVIAVGGDTVEVRCSVVYVNGTALASELVDPACTYDDYDDFRASWDPRECSRYRETFAGRTYDTFYARDRPERDRQPPRVPDQHDFPRPDAPAPSCASQEMFGPRDPLPQPQPELVETKRDAGPCEPQRALRVPPGALFVLGDHRDNSNDSRYWGVVPTSAIVGRVIGVYWPPGHAGAVR